MVAAWANKYCVVQSSGMNGPGSRCIRHASEAAACLDRPRVLTIYLRACTSMGIPVLVRWKLQILCVSCTAETLHPMSCKRLGLSAPFALRCAQGTYDALSDPPNGPAYSMHLKQIIKIMMTPDPQRWVMRTLNPSSSCHNTTTLVTLVTDHVYLRSNGSRLSRS